MSKYGLTWEEAFRVMEQTKSLRLLVSRILKFERKGCLMFVHKSFAAPHPRPPKSDIACKQFWPNQYEFQGENLNVQKQAILPF